MDDPFKQSKKPVGIKGVAEKQNILIIFLALCIMLIHQSIVES